MGYGVIGSPTVSGSVSLGSSPGTPARKLDLLRTGTTARSSTAPSSSGPGRRPLTAVARVRIPSGLRHPGTPGHPAGGFRVPVYTPGSGRARWSGTMCSRRTRTAPSSSGLGRRPLTAVARVRIPSGLRHPGTPGHPAGGFRVPVYTPGSGRARWSGTMCSRRTRTAPSSSGLGRRPLTAVARVRIPSGLRRMEYVVPEPPTHRSGALAVPGVGAARGMLASWLGSSAHRNGVGGELQ